MSSARKKKQEKKPKSIGERNRIVLAYMELGKDKTFQKLTEDHKLSLVKEVLAIGDEVASWIATEYRTNDPRKIAVAMGLRVFGEDKGENRGAEYREKQKEIIVYRDFHDKLTREIQDKSLSENLLKLLVAHELFHHLETDRIGVISRRFKFRGWKIGPFVKDKYIDGLSDVAAQAFTQTLLGLEISPQIFDYLTYILYTNR